MLEIKKNHIWTVLILFFNYFYLTESTNLKGKKRIVIKILNISVEMEIVITK